ncbi:MAG: glycosyl transferase [Ruminococcaceae bacterium]|nr:glycosyl transferase [Oscillospiraceae bacterium]
MGDEEYLKMQFKNVFGYDLDLEKPQTYSEKLQWLKLYDRNPLYTTMVDKAAVKDYVAEKIGEQHIIKTLGVWDRFDDIDFDALPEQFVLKCTHDSGGLVVCKDKKQLNKFIAKIKINWGLKTNFYRQSREWPYKDVKPRILAEEYMEDSKTEELRDYKFFAFDGEVKAMFIASERNNKDTETRFDFFDREFNHLPFTNGHPNAGVFPKKPEKFEEMMALAEKLSVGIPQARIDFYEVDGRVYFGEITFFHWGGMMPFEPHEWDEKFGEWIKIPNIE